MNIIYRVMITHLILIVPDPQSATVTSSLGTIVLNGSDVSLICSVQMNPGVLESELSLLQVNTVLVKPDGTILDLANPSISGTTFTYTTQVISFGDNDVGNYTCTATIRPQAASTYLTGSGTLSGRIEIVIGEKQTVLFKLACTIFCIRHSIYDCWTQCCYWQYWKWYRCSGSRRCNCCHHSTSTYYCSGCGCDLFHPVVLVSQMTTPTS